MAKIYKFDSGLTLLYTKNNVSKSTAVNIQFDCGARLDEHLHGLSHFCEHCFFTGTKQLDKQQVSKRYFDFIRANAYTTFSDIEFVGEIMTDKFADFLSTIADMICNSTFTQSAIEQEKKVVLQEIVRSEDNNDKKAWDFRRFCLTGLPEYKYGVLGTKDSVTKITSKDVKNYVKKYFVKNNCYMYVCSPLSFGKVKQIVKKSFEKTLPTNPKLKPLPYDDSPIITEPSLNICTVPQDKNYFYFILKSDKPTNLKQRNILGIISNMVTDFSEGLTKDLRIDKGLVYNLGSIRKANKNGWYGGVASEISTENINQCIDTIINYIKNIRENGFSAEQLIKEQERNEYYWQTRINNPNEMANRLEKYREYGRFISDKEAYQLIQNLTIDEVNSVAKDLFNNTNVSVIIYGGATKKDVYTIKQIQKKLKR